MQALSTAAAADPSDPWPTTVARPLGVFNESASAPLSFGRTESAALESLVVDFVYLIVARQMAFVRAARMKSGL